MSEYSTTIGIDLGDKYSSICVVDAEGEVLEESRLRTTDKALTERFEAMRPALVVLETGTHSRWVSHLLGKLGHEVVVGNARRLRMIYCNENKTDRLDAQSLARVARMDRKLLYEIQHRSHRAHLDLEQIKARDLLVNERKRIVVHIRSVVKTFGLCLPKCDTGYFCKKTQPLLPAELQEVLEPLYDVLEVLHEKIAVYDAKIKALAQQAYSECDLLREIGGVGPITALAFILTIEDPARFDTSRQVGSYFGLRPKLDKSGQRDPQLPITKCGNTMVRRLLVQAAHYILGHFGPDCDLRRFGLCIAERGGKRAKKRAVVAVARKLSVLMHRLWKNGEIYDPFFVAKMRGDSIG